MSAAGRLWRRAPAWRLCLVSAVMLTGLAALFPPSLPHWPVGHAPARPAAAAMVHAHFALPPEAAPIGDGAFQSPPPGHGRSGTMAFAGRQVVLPEGIWQTLVLTRTGTPDFLQSVLLARIEAGAVTGLLYAIAPDPLGHPTGPLGEPAPCFDPQAIVAEAVPEKGALPTVHECWELAPSRLLDPALRAAAEPHPHDPLMSALHRLDEFGAHLPPALLGATFFRSDETGWLSAAVEFPDTRAASPGTERRIVAWIRRYAAAFHKGYDGVAPEEAGAGVTHDPGAK